MSNYRRMSDINLMTLICHQIRASIVIWDVDPIRVRVDPIRSY